MSASIASGPWSRPHRWAPALGNGAGALLLGLAWRGADGVEGIGDPGTGLAAGLGWVNLAVAGLLLAGAGNGAWLLAGRRAVGRRRRALRPDVVAAPAVAASAEDAAWHWVAGTVRAHRAGCLLTRDREVRVVGAAEIRRRGLRRCEVCG